MTISYAITVHNEHEELNRLLSHLVEWIHDGDEIVIQGDHNNVSDEVVNVLGKYLFRHSAMKYVEYPLRIDGKPNFAMFKNNLFANCTGDYIFNIDADEMINKEFATNLRIVLAENSDVEVFRLPRINYVVGITPEYAKSVGFNIDPRDGRINWPDYQMRICKNNAQINWINPVHEVLTGFTTYVDFPMDDQFALIHVKDIDRQIAQNELYSAI